MCDCIEQINRQLAERKAEITQRLMLSNDLHDLSISPPVIATRWTGKKPRGKNLPILPASYCPFCGEKYSEEEKQE